MNNQSLQYILSVNCGSSSFKFALFEERSLEKKLVGSIDKVGSTESSFEIKNMDDGTTKKETGHFKDITAAVDAVVDWLQNNKTLYTLKAVGHRIVQGGPNHRQPEIITNDLLKDLKKYIFLAPNHLPDEIDCIKTFLDAFDQLPQVACFDTAFHKDMPNHAKQFPLPKKYTTEELIRYGFHGLSCESIMDQLSKDFKELDTKKILIAHLGNGASLTAVANGKSIDTTMGLSPIGGLVMGTRSGDLDPGAVLFLMKQNKLDADEMEEVLSKQSGLKAIAGTSDMQQLLKNENDEQVFKEAINIFCYQVKKYIGSMAAALGGLDILVFTGGIGSHSHIIRSMICEGLAFMGVQIDDEANRHHAKIISTKSKEVTIVVAQTDEEYMIAQHTAQIIIDK